MNTSVVKLNFMKFKWSELVHFAMYISYMLFNCPLFGNPPITKADFDAAILDLQSKGVLAYDPKSNFIHDRDEAILVLLEMMRQLANYIKMVSLGNAFIIRLSGFKANVFKNHHTKSKFTVKHGEISGSVIAKWGRDVQAFSYVVRYSINEEGLKDIFKEVNAGKTKVTIENLLKGKEYLFSLAIVDENGKSAFGNPVYLMVI